MARRKATMIVEEQFIQEVPADHLDKQERRALSVRLNKSVRTYHKEVERLLGLDEALFIAQLRYFLQRKGKSAPTITDDKGRRWKGVYNTYVQWLEWLPIMSVSKFKLVVWRLEQLEIIYTKRGPWQKWYGLNPRALLYFLDNPETLKTNDKVIAYH